MSLKSVLISAAMLSPLNSFAQAYASPSFDCDVASERSERIICSFDDLSAMDKKLHEILIKKSRQQPEYAPGGKEQSLWRLNVRDKCNDAPCLRGVYQARINDVSSKSDLPVGSSPSVINEGIDTKKLDQSSGNSQRLSGLSGIQEGAINPEAFIGNQQRLQQIFWSDPRNDLFGKNVLDWSDDDFILLDKKLKQQINSDLAATANNYKRLRLNSLPQNDSVFLSRKRDLEFAISRIPQFRDWVVLARQRLEKEEEARLQAEFHKKEQLALADQEAEEKRALLEEERKNLLEERQEKERIASEERELKRIKLEKEKQEKDTGFSFIIFIAVVVVLVVLLIWGVLAFFEWLLSSPKKCPECRSKEIKTQTVEELDRWKGKTHVSEKNSRGTNTRFMSVTKVENRYSYSCNKCGHEWAENIVEERG